MKSRSALQVVVIIGIANFFADFTYEGARAIVGPFLGSLGASAVIVGFVAGLGELMALRKINSGGRAVFSLPSTRRASDLFYRKQEALTILRWNNPAQFSSEARLTLECGDPATAGPL
jgi:hypothetical protein